MDKTLFIFGYGYSAAALTKQLLAQGWNIIATSRDRNKRKELMRLGVDAIDFDDTSAVVDGLAKATHLLSSVPPAKQADPVMANYREAIIGSAWQWIGYLSSTGVYGDHQGDWVTEDTPVMENPRGHIERRIYAEHSWLNLFHEKALPVHIFRLAGIYGPGRNLLKQLRDGSYTQSIYKEGQYFSRIHVDDITGALRASIAAPAAATIYNFADNEPAASHEVADYAATLLGLPLPPRISLEEAELSEMGRSFWSQNKRVSNAKLRNELGYALLYPTYREGLHQLLALTQSAKRQAS